LFNLKITTNCVLWNCSDDTLCSFRDLNDCKISLKIMRNDEFEWTPINVYMRLNCQKSLESKGKSWMLANSVNTSVKCFAHLFPYGPLYWNLNTTNLLDLCIFRYQFRVQNLSPNLQSIYKEMNDAFSFQCCQFWLNNFIKI